MTTDQVVDLLSTQGLALVLVIGGALWATRVLVPRYLDGIKDEVNQAREETKEGLERQSFQIEEQTSAIEVLTALMLSMSKVTMTPQEFEDLLLKVRLLRKKANGGA